jgi:hypothetical protein
VKRFNEEVGCAPAPNAYDSQLPRSKASIALLKSQRFEEAKVRNNLSTFCIRQFVVDPLGLASCWRIRILSIFNQMYSNTFVFF